MLMVFLSVAALIASAVLTRRSLTARPGIDRIVKVSTVRVIGAEAGSFEGAAAILGSSNIIRAMQGIDARPEKKAEQ